MKKRTLFLSLVLAALVLAGYAAAVGGDALDPLISLDFLDSTFRTQAEAQLDSAVAKADAAALDEAGTRWSAAVAKAEAAASTEYTALWTETRLKQGDILSGGTGLQVLPLAGGMTVSFSSGAVVDVTDGTELTGGDALKSNHRYLVAEDTVALFTVSSKTAVVNYCGGYSFTLSSTPDYNAMADALRSLSLFRGTGSGSGSGYELENVPTRIESLIMLLRMLGEEEAALACTAEHPFVDVPDWCVPYVAYAWEKGYSNGVGKDRYGRDLFGPQYASSATQYTEFMLRALGYSSTATTDISDAPDRALSAGLLTSGEHDALQSGDFLRADIAYLSFYALSAHTSDGTELSRKLISAGVFTSSDYRAAKAMVTTDRIA